MAAEKRVEAEAERQKEVQRKRQARKAQEAADRAARQEAARRREEERERQRAERNYREIVAELAAELRKAEEERKARLPKRSLLGAGRLLTEYHDGRRELYDPWERSIITLKPGEPVPE